MATAVRRSRRTTELVAAGSPNAGVVDEIENPNPQPGTNNWYTEDGYGGGSFGSASFGGGTYSNCSDSISAGVAQLTDYLARLRTPDRSPMRTRATTIC